MEEIKEILSGIKHPEINNSLTELGMIGNIYKNDDAVWVIELKLPFKEIPIKDYLIQQIVDALSPKLTEKFGIMIKEMTQEEREYFMQLSQQNWAL